MKQALTATIALVLFAALEEISDAAR